MFFHNFKYTLKILFRNKLLIFWTYAFPLILGTFFYMAFSNIENSEKLNEINIAIIQNDEFDNNLMYKSTFEKLSEDNDDKIFNIKYVEEEKAKELLENKDIVGYMKLENNIPKIKQENFWQIWFDIDLKKKTEPTDEDKQEIIYDICKTLLELEMPKSIVKKLTDAVNIKIFGKGTELQKKTFECFIKFIVNAKYVSQVI